MRYSMFLLLFACSTVSPAVQNSYECVNAATPKCQVADLADPVEYLNYAICLSTNSAQCLGAVALQETQGGQTVSPETAQACVESGACSTDAECRKLVLNCWGF